MPDFILKDENRKKLDGIVSQMVANKESDSDIQLVVEDFKSKYGEKKNPVGNGLGIGTATSKNGFAPSQIQDDTKTPIKFNQLVKNIQDLNKGKTSPKDFADPRLSKLWQQTRNQSQPKDFIEKGIAATFDLLGDQVPTRVKNAWEQGKLQGEIANILPIMSSPDADKEEIANQIATYTRLSEQIPQSEEAKKLNEEGVLWAFRNPIEGAKALGETIISSLAGQIKASERTSPSAVAIGAGMGSAIPGVGTLAGAVSGLTAGQILAGMNVESSSTFLQTIKDAGFPLNDENKLAAAFSDKKLIDKARDLGIKRGIPIAIFDMLAAGVGGRIAAGTLNKIAKPLAVAGVEALGGSTGELAAQITAGQEIDPNAIALEGIAEIGAGAPALLSETGGAVIERKKTSSSNQNIIKQIANDKETGVIETKQNLDRNLQDGLISPEEHQEGIEFVDKVIATDEKIPAKVEGERREKSIELISEKEKTMADIEELKAEKKATDDVYHAPIDGKIERREAKIESINKELTDLSKKPEALTKAETDLETLKQVSDKVRKYDASLKRLTDAKNAGTITENEFNDMKSRFDDVMGSSAPAVPNNIQAVKNTDGTVTVKNGDVTLRLRDENHAKSFAGKLNSQIQYVEALPEVAVPEGQPAEESVAAATLKDVIDSYEQSDSSSFNDLVNSVEQFADQNADAELLSAVEKYRKERQEDFELAGRGDMEAAEKEFINVLNAKQNAIQEQTTNEIPLQPEAAVSAEVAEGVPGAGLEVVTEQSETIPQGEGEVTAAFDLIEQAKRTKKTEKGKMEAGELAIANLGDVGKKAIFIDNNFKDIVSKIRTLKDQKGEPFVKIDCT